MSITLIIFLKVDSIYLPKILHASFYLDLFQTTEFFLILPENDWTFYVFTVHMLILSPNVTTPVSLKVWSYHLDLTYVSYLCNGTRPNSGSSITTIWTHMLLVG